MFERYTEKARRSIFFARYEASQYGSPFIETEHLLLGLIRENRDFFSRVLGRTSPNDIRSDVERLTEPPRDRISTATELPLTNECKEILMLAAKEADQLAHRHIDAGHLFLAILTEGKCRAAQILNAHGIGGPATRLEVRVQLDTKEPTVIYSREPDVALGMLVDKLLTAWSATDSKKVSALFSKKGWLWDTRGESHVGPKDVEKAFAQEFSSMDFAPTQGDVRDVKSVVPGVAVVTIVWSNAQTAEAIRRKILMMLVAKAGETAWEIVSAHLSELRG